MNKIKFDKKKLFKPRVCVKLFKKNQIKKLLEFGYKEHLKEKSSCFCSKIQKYLNNLDNEFIDNKLYYIDIYNAIIYNQKKETIVFISKYNSFEEYNYTNIYLGFEKIIKNKPKN
jgi:hypothetical protein